MYTCFYPFLVQGFLSNICEGLKFKIQTYSFGADINPFKPLLIVPTVGFNERLCDSVRGCSSLLQSVQCCCKCGECGKCSSLNKVMKKHIRTQHEKQCLHLRLLAQTSLRNILGTKNLHETLSDRDSISMAMQASVISIFAK